MLRAGLFGYDSSGLQALPLQRVSVVASVYDLCAEVKVTQVYCNNPASIVTPRIPIQSPAFPYTGYGDGNAGIECVFVFPLDEESAVFSFTCELDGRVVHAQIQEKVQARGTYSHAVRSNISAMLLEQQAENIFTCRVGRLRQGSICIITITYLTLLDQEGRFNRFTLPLFIAPKYTPPSHTVPLFADPFWKAPVAPQLHVHNGHGCDSCLMTPIIGPRFHCMQCPDYDLCSTCYKTKSHDHAMQELTGGLSSSKSIDALASSLPMASMQAKLEDLTICIFVQMPSHILSIQGTSHPQDTLIQQQTDTRATVYHSSRTQCFLSKDFVIMIEQEACFDPRVLCELDVANHTAAVSLAFIPRPSDMMATTQLQCELIFILDCSGSMEGASVRCVAECMQLLLRSLPVNCIFNIIRFGSSWSSLFPSSTPYNNASLHAASQYASGLRADLGGTEMYAPLKYAICNHQHSTHPRQIFLLTDAQVSNVDSLVGLVSKHGTNMRVFTIGIGHCADRSLCKRIAQAGNGKCEFVSADDSAGGIMSDKVMRQLGRALQPALTNLKVDWKNLAKGSNISTGLRKMSIDEEKEASNRQAVMVPALPSLFLQCPSVAPAIFVNSRFVLHALNVNLPDAVWDQAAADKDIHIHEEIHISAKASFPNESVEYRRSVILTGEQLTRATVIHTLAARARIRELEELVLREAGPYTKGKLEEEILALSLRYSLASSKASFVAVYDNGDVNSDALQIEGSVNMRPGSGWPSSLIPTPSYQFLCSGLSSSACTGPNVQTRFGSTMPTSIEYESEECCIEDESEECCIEDESEEYCIEDESEEYFPSSSDNAHRLFGFSGGSNGFTPAGTTGSISRGSLERLVFLQLADGTWNITPPFVEILRAEISSPAITMESLKTVCVKHGVLEQVVATLAALLFLDTHCKERQPEWQLLASKSQFYLANMANLHESLQSMILEDIKLLGI